MPAVRSVFMRARQSALSCLATLACATKPGEPVDPEPKRDASAAVEPAVADPRAERSLEAALDEAQAALDEDAGPGPAKARLGLAIEQALAREARARNRELELEAVSLLAQLDPIPDPGPRRCRINSEGICIHTGKKRKSGDEEAPEPIPYDEIERARLDAYARYEAEATPGEALRVIRERHIRLRLAHREFEIALVLLQDYVVDYQDHASAVAAALALVDTFVNVITKVRDRPPIYATSALAWFERLETLALWQHPDGLELRELIAELRPGLMWRAAMEARDEGSDEWVALSEAGHGPGHELQGFRRCAEIFLEIYNAYPQHDRADTLLWNAAECFEANYDFGEAYATRVALLERYPDSQHYQTTLRYLAEMDHAIARYAAAKQHYLEFARLYPKAWEATDALLWAYRFGEALGHDSSELVAEYVRRERRKNVEDTGKFVWTTRPEQPEELLAFAEEFIHEYRSRAGAASFDAQRVAAELSWARACPGRLEDGLCVATKQRSRTPGCSLAGEPLPVFRARASKLADLAQQRFRSVVENSNHLRRAVHVDESEWGAEILAAAAFALVEAELEVWLVAGPDAPKARERAKQLDARYLEVAELGQVDYAIRAHGRRGLIWEVLATPGLRPHDGVCLPATAWAEGDRKRALAGYAQCLAIAVEHQHLSEAARRCEAKLAAAEPERTQPLFELFGEPGLLEVGIEGTGVVPRCRPTPGSSAKAAARDRCP